MKMGMGTLMMGVGMKTLMIMMMMLIERHQMGLSP